MTALLLLLLKTLLVFAAAGLSLWALRRGAAAARHLVCLLTLAALLVLPILSLSLPGWQMLPALPGPDRSLNSPLTPNAGGTGASVLAQTHVVPFVSPPSARLAPLLALPNASAPPASPRPFPWPPLLLSVWAVGVLLALARPLVGLWGIRQLSRLSVPVTEASTLALAADCAVALRLPRLPELRQAPVPVPMTWGSRRPILLLPQNAEYWPEERRRAVLLHEMAHVRRRDWLAHRLADLACALYWFHPLVWLTARRLRTEGEIVCDDLVLASGIPAPDYARLLLEIAHALPPISVVPQTAIAMAYTSRIERRLKMILDTAQSRRTLTRGVLMAALGLGAVALVPLAMLRPAARAQDAAINPPSSSWQRILGNGATVELVGVSNVPALRAGWWKPDGSFLAQAPCDSDALTPDGESNLGAWRQFALRLVPPGVAAETASTQYEISGATQSTWGQASRHQRLLPGLDLVAARFTPLTGRGLIRCGVAIGAWETREADDYPYTLGPTSVGGILFSRPSEIAGDAAVTVTHSLPDAQIACRVIAVDVAGKVYTDSSEGSVGMGEIRQATWVFKGLSLKHVKQFRFQTRPFQWTEFKNVALEPAK